MEPKAERLVASSRWPPSSSSPKRLKKKLGLFHKDRARDPALRRALVLRLPKQISALLLSSRPAPARLLCAYASSVAARYEQDSLNKVAQFYSNTPSTATAAASTCTALWVSALQSLLRRCCCCCRC